MSIGEFSSTMQGRYQSVPPAGDIWYLPQEDIVWYLPSSIMKTVRTRVAPSPTGYPHLGLVYQAIFDFVLARKYNGKFVLRIEDTDRARFVEGAEDVIYNALSWVNLLPDEGPKEGGEYGPYRQSERLELYQKYANQLIESGHAYRCFCTKERLEEMRKNQEKNHQPPMYDKTCRNLSKDQINKNSTENLPFVVRMKIPENQKIVVCDEIVGDVEFDSNQLDENVILKSDGFPTYHLALVVDDYLMKITHVFRGTEWIPSFPKHQLLWEYLGWEKDMPLFIHIPLLLNSQGPGKLSKRHVHTSVDYYKSEGFLPEAVVNYLANIVWNHPEDKEIFPIMDFGQAFDLENRKFDIRSNGVKFDLQKLLWMNGEYIRQTENSKLKVKIYEFFNKQYPEDIIEKTIPLIKERIKTLAEYEILCSFFYTEPKEYEVDLSAHTEVIKKTAESLTNVQNWKADAIGDAMQEVAKTMGVKNSEYFMLLRVTVTGKKISPPLNDSMELLGKDETLKRLNTVL